MQMRAFKLACKARHTPNLIPTKLQKPAARASKNIRYRRRWFGSCRGLGQSGGRQRPQTCKGWMLPRVPGIEASVAYPGCELATSPCAGITSLASASPFLCPLFPIYPVVSPAETVTSGLVQARWRIGAPTGPANLRSGSRQDGGRGRAPSDCVRGVSAEPNLSSRLSTAARRGSEGAGDAPALLCARSNRILRRRRQRAPRTTPGRTKGRGVAGAWDRDGQASPGTHSPSGSWSEDRVPGLSESKDRGEREGGRGGGGFEGSLPLGGKGRAGHREQESESERERERESEIRRARRRALLAHAQARTHARTLARSHVDAHSCAPSRLPAARRASGRRRCNRRRKTAGRPNPNRNAMTDHGLTRIWKKSAWAAPSDPIRIL